MLEIVAVGAIAITLEFLMPSFFTFARNFSQSSVSDLSTLINSLPKKNPDSSGAKLEESNDYIAIENWTKWRIYVRQKPEDTPQVIYARTGENISFLNQVYSATEFLCKLVCST